ncbi:hypothetical protein HRI_003340000 [Hibiscus trionum]|uniref:Germin-like protein n=1 Tax=Hibiscus trionum TaxID=183268 RepID=A0A9W7MAP0_HIBTR|nr:hypothetical protein HRI_003340000 [Hibiscus trionum]
MAMTVKQQFFLAILVIAIPLSAISGDLDILSDFVSVTYDILEVGFVDTTNKLFTRRLQADDMFVFPKGLVHYQFKSAWNDFAIAVSTFGSATAGTISDPSTIFTINIDDYILAKSFKTNVQTIQKIKEGFPPKA